MLLQPDTNTILILEISGRVENKIVGRTDIFSFFNFCGRRRRGRGPVRRAPAAAAAAAKIAMRRSAAKSKLQFICLVFMPSDFPIHTIKHSSFRTGQV